MKTRFVLLGLASSVFATACSRSPMTLLHESDAGLSLGGNQTVVGGTVTGGIISPIGGAPSTGGILTGGFRTGGIHTGGDGNPAGAPAGGWVVTTGGEVPSAGAPPAMTGGRTGGIPGGTGGSLPACSSNDSRLPCEILKANGSACVAAHSTVRVIAPGYTGPLYQVCKGTYAGGPNSCKGEKQDIGNKDGYADVATQESFCAFADCRIVKIYDQSGNGNDLEPAPKGAAKLTPANPAKADSLPVSINGRDAYGLLIKPGIGYRTGCMGCTVEAGMGMAKGDEPQTIYMVTSQKDLVDGCCFDYGNAETTNADDGNGCAEAVYFGGGVVWGTGYGGKPGPWVMADLENGLYAGWENTRANNISTNTKLLYDFVTAVLLGDTKEKNQGQGRFALYGGDATAGILKTMYDGIRPEKIGYVPMQKQGSLVLGISGDNSNGGGGRFYEGAVAAGGPVATADLLAALQCSIVAAKYASR